MRARGKNVCAWATLAKRGEIRPKGGQMGPQGADILHAGIFLSDENIMFSKQGTKTKGIRKKVRAEKSSNRRKSQTFFLSNFFPPNFFQFT